MSDKYPYSLGWLGVEGKSGLRQTISVSHLILKCFIYMYIKNSWYFAKSIHVAAFEKFILHIVNVDILWMSLMEIILSLRVRQFTKEAVVMPLKFFMFSFISSHVIILCIVLQITLILLNISICTYYVVWTIF